MLPLVSSEPIGFAGYFYAANMLGAACDRGGLVRVRDRDTVCVPPSLLYFLTHLIYREGGGPLKAN